MAKKFLPNFERTGTKSLAEVKYSRQDYELKEFYKNHYLICGAIAGVNKITLHTDDFDYEPMLIKKKSFDLAIKRLKAFFIQNYIYFVSNLLRKEIEKEIDDLYENYLDDEEYHDLCDRMGGLDDSDESRLEFKYVQYVVKCFNIVETICIGLQKTILLSPRTINKMVKYNSDTIFFDQLSVYRSTIETLLSNFTFDKIAPIIRGIIGYSYTYRYLLDKYQIKMIDKYVNIAVSYYVNPEIMDLIRESKSSGMTLETKRRIRKETNFIQKVLGRIYILTNQGLSDRNILPKINRRVNYDRSTM